MKVLDLFSGIGGFSLGLERAGFETVAFCEIDPFCQKVLKKHWPDVPIYEDITKLRGEDIGPVDVITGGYPCQPFSHAGKRRGQEDDRHLWPEMFRLIQSINPQWIIAENVIGHITMGLDKVLSDLEAEKYTIWPFIIPACGVDAPHRRDRVWIVAEKNDSNSNRIGSHRKEINKHREGKPFNGKISDLGSVCEVLAGQKGPGKRDTKDVANSKKLQCDGSHSESKSEIPELRNGSSQDRECKYWPTEPNVGRVANGIPRRVDRLRSLGNSVVPQIPEIIGRAINETYL